MGEHIPLRADLGKFRGKRQIIEMHRRLCAEKGAFGQEEAGAAPRLDHAIAPASIAGEAECAVLIGERQCERWSPGIVVNLIGFDGKASPLRRAARGEFSIIDLKFAREGLERWIDAFEKRLRPLFDAGGAEDLDGL